MSPLYNPLSLSTEYEYLNLTTQHQHEQGKLTKLKTEAFRFLTHISFVSSKARSPIFFGGGGPNAEKFAILNNETVNITMSNPRIDQRKM